MHFLLIDIPECTFSQGKWEKCLRSYHRALMHTINKKSCGCQPDQDCSRRDTTGFIYHIHQTSCWEQIFLVFFITVLFILLLIYKAFLSTQKMVELVKIFVCEQKKLYQVLSLLYGISKQCHYSVLISLFIMQKVQCLFFLFRIVENMAACKQWHLSVSRQTVSTAQSVFDIMLSEYLYLSTLI